MPQATGIGPVMIDIEGLLLNEAEKDKLRHPNTGAVILFARNYDNPQQITELIQNIRATRKTPLLIAVDQEGGRVQRFQAGFTRLPAAAAYARCGQQAQAMAESAGWLMASELLSVGIDFSFAPVLDVDCGISTIIGDRAFAQEPEAVIQTASAFKRGMHNAGMAAVGKHFPGHGAVAADSHQALPVDERDLDTIYQRDIRPFQALIEQGLEAIMPAHVVYCQCDSQPAGFSLFWIEHILREKLQFDGAVFSDDLSMEGAAVAGDFSQRAQKALAAGCDMVLVCNNPVAAEQVLETLPVKPDPIRQRRLDKLFARQKIDRTALLDSTRWRQCHKQITQL